MADLRTRSSQAELMDDPAIDPHLLDDAMQRLESINQTLNGYRPSLVGIRRVLPANVRAFSLLDVGCGSGDTLRQIARWARRHNIQAKLHGIDLSGTIAQRAIKRCSGYPEITIAHADFMDMQITAPFDIVHCAMVIHHIPDDAFLVAFVRKMASMSRHGIVINDLHRHPLAYHSIKALTRLIWTNPIIQHDAPLSVARSFTREELKCLATAAGLTSLDISWHWAFRWLLTARKSAKNATR